MAEVIHVFSEPIVLDGVPYLAQVAARADGHIWEGWIEFAAVDGSDHRRTGRETTQPDRDAVAYWASGISRTYLEGALQRTMTHPRPTQAPPPGTLFDSPAPAADAPAASADTRAILDPFSVGAKGETLLRRELSALAPWHLRNIVRAYDIAADTVAATDLERLTQAQLIDLIVAAAVPS